MFNVVIAFNPAITAATPSGPATTPQTAPPASGGGGGSGAASGGAPVGVAGKVVFPAGSLRRTSPKTAAPKSTKAGKSTGKTTNAGNTTTPTTAYVWKGGSGAVAAGQFDDQVTPPGAVAARPPILPQESTAKIASDSGNRYGLGILVLVLGAGAAARAAAALRGPAFLPPARARRVLVPVPLAARPRAEPLTGARFG